MSHVLNLISSFPRELWRAFLQDQHERWIGALVTTACLMTVFRLIELENYGEHLWQSFGYTSLYWQVNATLVMFLRNRYPRIEQTSKRLGIEAVGVVFLTALISQPPFYFGWTDHTLGPVTDYLVGFIASVIVLSIYEAVYFFRLWKEAMIETEKWKRARAESEYQVLSHQVNPHFLFNSLNTLTSLIAEAPETAISFTQHLSEVYRYVLQRHSQELVTLREEVEFAKKYVYLLQIRHGESLSVNFELPNEDLGLSLPPAVLQLLLENAVKHNIVSKAKPLIIRVLSENHHLVVVNPLQPRLMSEPGTGTGLENIRQRYQLLTHLPVQIEQTATHFRVSLPLIQIENYAYRPVGR